jgi:hypothetical protein
MQKTIKFSAEEALIEKGRPVCTSGEKFTLGISFRAIPDFYFGSNGPDGKPAALKLSQGAFS